MNEYKKSQLPSQVVISDCFDESCHFHFSTASIEAIESNRLKVTIIKHGSREQISNLILKIFAVSGHLFIHVGNDNTEVVFGENTSGAYDLRLWHESSVFIGPGTTSNGVRIVCARSSFRCGTDCMFSDEILIQSSDQHGIVDLNTGKIINHKENTVELGDHVWLGRGCILTPRAKVGNGSMIATGAIVTNTIDPMCIAGGVPARVIKTGRTWSRYLGELDAYSIKYCKKYSQD